ncbi:NUDIX domain-containing protein [Hwangdonia lutea]|uniref:GDP-mannose pyrophosphatase n=1 Tax=Hwangdonia lutea TaxID=3075823 RepID=A0AA97HPV2_9FLAO|nr:NUDIX domain-containing protein [Hwangdonia sp. SCSIO 19198]WOD43037.1 NUDIX domain-containing protein [Hwangdonia sp. SCSIO 19198]
MNRIKNIKSTVLSHFWGKLERIDFDFKFKNGNWKRLSHEAYGKSDGVAILLYNTETKKVVLSKQFRIPVYISGVSEGVSIEVCGGAIDEGESPETTVIREAKEELGYHISNLKAVNTVFLSPGIVRERVHLFIGEYKDLDKIDNSGGGLEIEGEEIEVMELPVEEALNMIDSQEIIDARTIMLLQHVKIKGLLS